MSANFDPYYTWLGIPPEEQPPHHYRLLGLKPLEANLDVIETAADRQMKHLRDYQSGKNGELCQRLLNEVAAARVTLLAPERKSAYDAELQAKLNLQRQAELKKARQERPLAVAQALPAATRGSGEKGVGSGERAAASPQISAATSGAKPRGANNNIALLVAAGVVALVLLVGGGIAAMMFLPDDEPVVAVTEASDGPVDDEPPSTTTNSPPVVPPVIPPPIDDQPEIEPAPPTPIDPPAEEPAAEDPEPDDEPIDEDPVDEVALVDEPDAPKKLPIPDKAAREAKRKEILAIFPIAKAKTFEEKGELAAQLISTAGETADDPAAVFAMLNLAREQAAEAGQIKLAFEATDMLGETFDFDASAVRVASLQQAARAQLPPAAKREIVIAGMDVIDELSAADQFDEADALSDRMLAIARPLRDAELIKQLAEQKRAVDEVAASYKKAQSAFETLTSSPDDADANLAAGKYLAFVKQDWEAGLAHLAKGSDTSLAAAAKAELAAPTEPADQEKLADAWWSAADVQKEPSLKDQCRAQAVSWYREIVDNLGGLAKVKVEKRIAESANISAVAARVPRQDTRDVETVYLTDLKEVDSRVGYASLQKAGPDAALKLLNEAWHCGILTHAVSDGIAYVNYDLNGEFETFETIATIRHDAVSPLVFRVVGDDRVLWQSLPSKINGSAVQCRVPVKKVRQLSLQVLCKGSSHYGHGWWVNPRISRYKAEAAQSEPDLGIFSRDPDDVRGGASDEVVFLDDLTEVESQTGWEGVKKHGEALQGYKVEVDGKPFSHSLFMHARTSGASFATYRLDGKYSMFDGTAALINPGPDTPGESASELTFSVIGDEKILWKSRPIKRHGDTQPFKLNIRGIDVLKLNVDCAGSDRQGWTAWLNPRLSAVTTTSSSRPAAESGSPTETRAVYLDDLVEFQANLAIGNVGKHGRNHIGSPFTFQGEMPKHSVFVHAQKDGQSSVTYDLDGKYATFEAIAALADQELNRTKSDVPLTFSVSGDDKELWKSKPLQTRGEGEPCKVNVRGIKKLTLRVDCPGFWEGAWSVWIDPRVSRSGQASQEASVPEYTGSVICKVLEGKRQPIELAEGAIAFGGPRGDGRVGANGFVVDAPEAWKETGTIWSCSYRRGGSANGMHFIHPLGAGHVIVTPTNSGILAASLPRWPDNGYTGGTGSIPLTTVPNFAAVVQFEEEPHQLTSAVAANGEFAFYVDGTLIAAGRFTDAVAINLGEGFHGQGFDPALRPGQAGVIMGPLDNGINRAEDVRLAVIEKKSKKRGAASDRTKKKP